MLSSVPLWLTWAQAEVDAGEVGGVMATWKLPFPRSRRHRREGQRPQRRIACMPGCQIVVLMGLGYGGGGEREKGCQPVTSFQQASLSGRCSQIGTCRNRQSREISLYEIGKMAGLRLSPRGSLAILLIISEHACAVGRTFDHRKMSAGPSASLNSPPYPYTVATFFWALFLEITRALARYVPSSLPSAY